MNFKEALIAHLQGEKVEVKSVFSGGWQALMTHSGQACIGQLDDPKFGSECEFRLSPRTIFVNGVEVPAPEKVAPADGSSYYIPDPLDERLYDDLTWRGDDIDERALSNGVLYLSTDACVARAKAMLLTSEK